MTRVNINITINRPADKVFAYLSNPEKNPIWQGGMKEAIITSDGPLGVGSTYTQIASFLGRRIESNFEIVAYEPGRMIKGKTTASSFPIEFTRAVEPSGEATQVHALIEGEAGGFFKLFGPLLNWIVRRSIKGDYANLKRILEEE